LSRSILAAALAALSLTVAGCGSSGGSGASVAATVNGQDISMVTYNKELDYQRIAAQDNYNFDVCSSKQTQPLCSEVKRTALSNLISNVIVAQYAAHHHITVSETDFNRRWAVIDKTRFHDQPAVVTAYAKRYGWTPSDLYSSIRRDILQEKVMLAVTGSMSSYVAATKLSKIDVSKPKDAQRVQREVRAGKPFSRVISELQSGKKPVCSSAQICGELGWMPNSFLPAGDKSVLTAAPGTMIGPLTGQQVFEFLYVEGHNNHYRMTTGQQFQLRQQLFQKWLVAQERRASIQQHVHV
jgi:parvulin-like peptidyl-prolyl isomerase